MVLGNNKKAAVTIDILEKTLLLCMVLKSLESLQHDMSKAEKRHPLAAVWPAEWEQRHASLLRLGATVQSDSMQKQMVHLGEEAT